MHNDERVRVTKSESTEGNVPTKFGSEPSLPTDAIVTESDSPIEGIQSVGFLGPGESADIVEIIKKEVSKRVSREVKAQLEQYGIGIEMEPVVMSKDECKKLIMEEIDNHPEGIYPSDIAFKYSLDFDFVDECFEELETNGQLGGS